MANIEIITKSRLVKTAASRWKNTMYSSGKWYRGKETKEKYEHLLHTKTEQEVTEIAPSLLILNCDLCLKDVRKAAYIDGLGESICLCTSCLEKIIKKLNREEE